VAAAFLDYERAQAKARKQSGVNLPENFPEGGEARDKAGERMGICGRTVEDAPQRRRTCADDLTAPTTQKKRSSVDSGGPVCFLCEVA
jgi:hypothetical protein